MKYIVLSLVLPLIIIISSSSSSILHLMKLQSDIARYRILWKRNADGRARTTDLRMCKSGALPLRQPSIY